MSGPSINRRSFLGGAVAAGAALGLGLRPAWADEPTGKPAAGKIGDFKISLAEWSLHKALFAKTIDNLDFPKVARDDYGIEGVEFVNQFFKDKAHDSAYLKDLKSRANDHGVTCVLIMIDGEGDLSAKDEAKRTQAVENHKKWVDAAAALGCHSIRVNTGSNYSARRRLHGGRRLRAACRVRLVEQDQHHLREPRRAFEQSRRPARPDQGREQARVRHPARLRQLPEDEAERLRNRHLRRDRPDDALRQGRLGQELRLRSRWRRDDARLRPDPQDRHRRGLSRLRRHRVRGEPALREPEGIRATKKLLESLRGSEYKPS